MVPSRTPAAAPPLLLEVVEEAVPQRIQGALGQTRTPELMRQMRQPTPTACHRSEARDLSRIANEEPLINMSTRDSLLWPRYAGPRMRN